MRRAAVLLLAFLAVLLAGVPTAPAAEEAAGAADDGWRADRVLVVGVPGLVWDDVDPDRTPALWELADTSPVGAVSVRAARSTTCLLDGWATLGAGNRARFPAPDELLPMVPLPTVPLPGETPGTEEEPGAAPSEAPTPAGPPASPELSHCGLQERLAQAGLADPLSAVRAVAEDGATARFGAEPGALGAAVGCATVVGRAAALAVAAPGVGLTREDALPADDAALAALLEPCPLTLVSLDGLVDAGVPAPEGSETGTDPVSREVALTAIDAQVAQLRAAVAALPGETLLLVQGVSEVNDGRPQLHVGIASGPGFTDVGWLSSASTGRAPFTQLIDVAPTVLRALGLEQPASLNGQPLTVTGDRPGTAQAVAELTRANTAAVTHHRSTGTFFLGLVAVQAAVVVLGMLVLGLTRDAGVRPSRARWRPVLRLAALAAAALPVATYLAGLVPWERAGSPRWALAGSLLLAGAAVVAPAVLGPWRRSRLGPPLAVLAVTVATLVGDVLTGSSLELNALLGYDAIVAGRFTGYGNLSSGLLSSAALVGTAVVATLAGRRAGAGRDDGGRRARRVTGAVVLAAGLVTVAVVGAPGLGRDFGGVLAVLPGFLLLAMLLTGVRVTVVRLAAVLAAGVVAVGTLAFLDWLRPAAERSHLGRFVEQLLTGEAWTVVSRKASANLDILVGSALAWMLPVALVAAIWLVRRRRAQGPGPLRRPGLLCEGGSGLRAGDAAVLRAGLVAAALSLALGAAVNDSGVALPATAAALLVPLLVDLATTARGGRAQPPDGVPGGGDDRVTVGSRGSTWNT
ncbi:hypothetical protein GCM10027451_49610 [Geodermatophilus aquaeductus]|uniref:Uncharacterized protein n=1 Tax=Geodermatophilus aquaeductus TaxID=1564161 RepID=A0A521FTN7_9ACTN|nr:hypothetical protein [Geodermatophilus aquaeductus]SMO99585.1 hypothetical protein SAMN06273567_11757 [Geodermatophilus aquaeductus]